MSCTNIKIKWHGKGLKEVGIDQNNIIRVKVSSTYYRPYEINKLQGNYKKAQKVINWSPKTNFEELIKIMLRYDLSVEGINLKKYSKLD